MLVEWLEDKENEKPNSSKKPKLDEQRFGQTVTSIKMLKQYSKRFVPKNTDSSTQWAVRNFEARRAWRNSTGTDDTVPVIDLTYQWCHRMYLDLRSIQCLWCHILCLYGKYAVKRHFETPTQKATIWGCEGPGNSLGESPVLIRDVDAWHGVWLVFLVCWDNSSSVRLVTKAKLKKKLWQKLRRFYGCEENAAAKIASVHYGSRYSLYRRGIHMYYFVTL